MTDSPLLFERFLDPDRGPLPDIDLNFVNTPTDLSGRYGSRQR